ncbi:hypothetical protein [Mucilaginibacter sp. UR6-11]|uniref:hypothetical protein n=1 Tax=Mucilaginibacter sp. UR6-11 TaxID=1435644 RepID=UPI001E3BE052|nr:hypothetical protein [Mucilaginibacter sp. UR6-11]MCC8427306.1 hypothetical protein [Mucilaginibacter sp. UR6-11]
MKKSIFIINIILISFHAFAQLDLKNYVNTVPPNIASFEKYGNTPVNYSSGQISNSINLYTFEIDSHIKIPIDLIYGNSGLKPDAIPSWVGNGWDLMPGGYITQEIRGIDDLLPGGLVHDESVRTKLSNYINGVTTNPTDKYHFIKDVLNGNGDSQPDIFSLNILGRSTRFYFDGTTVKFINYMPFKVELQSPIGFIVTDEMGYKYYFVNSIANSGSHNDDIFELASLGGTRTWNLDKIVTPNNEEVLFQYSGDAIYTTTNSSTTYTWGPGIGAYSGNSDYQCIPGFTGPNNSESTSTIAQSILQSISYKNRKINFETIVRNDIQTVSGSVAHALSAIKVFNENNELINNIQFTYNNNLRLRLDKVAMLNPLTSEPVKNYAFAYYNSPADVSTVPLITSPNRVYGLDYWGYYNGQNANSPLSVTDIDYSQMFPGLTSRFGHNTHYSDNSFSMIGMLKRITYPTGGYSEYEYESNQMLYPNGVGMPPFLRTDAVPIYTNIFDRGITCNDNNGDGVGYFVINQDSPNIEIQWNFTTLDNSDLCTLEIKKNGDSQNTFETFGYTVSGSKHLLLSSGTYQYHLHSGCAFAEANAPNRAEFNVRSFVLLNPLPVNVGGNRILRVKDFDNTGNLSLIRKLSYAQPELNQAPSYIDNYNVISESYVQSPWPHMICGPVYSIGEHNLADQTGFHITYRQVIEDLGENGENGKNVYYYDSKQLVTGNYLQSPFPPTTDLSWRDNDLLRKEIYKNTGSAFIKQQSTGFVYSPVPLPSTYTPEVLKGLKFGIAGKVVLGNEDPQNYNDYFNSGSIFLPTDRHAQVAVSDTLFNDNGALIVTQTTHSYSDQDFLLSKSTSTGSDGSLLEKSFWYANDFNSGANVATLKANHIIGESLKAITSKNGNIVSGQIITADDFGNITESYNYEGVGSQPKPLHDPNNYYLPNFTLRNNLSYNSYNKVKQMLKTNGSPVAILWGYNGSYPVAEIKNASYQQVLNALGQTTIDQLNTNPGNDSTLRGIINTLRTALPSAEVTTYTYNPLIGMTSSTDPKGMTTFYEYDSFQRLMNIRDKDLNIIKHIDYNYHH